MPNKDRRKTIIKNGQKVNFVHLDPDFVPPFEQITSVAVVPFMEDGRIVAIDLRSRGIDIPGGHVLENENSIEETAKREIYEEACITLKDIKIATIIQSDYYGSSSNELTYMVITAAMVDRIEEFVPNPESSSRKIIAIDEFLSEYTAGNVEDMRQIISSARKAMLGQ